MKIFIVRHGQDFDNLNGILNGRRDEVLTDLGREQANKTARKLKSAKIDFVYSSPLKRAFETAKIIADYIGIDNVLIDDDLVERDFGVLTGKPINEIKKLAKEVLSINGVDYFLDAKNSESFPDVLKRVSIFLKKISLQHPDENILLVTHGDTGKMIRAAYMGWDWKRGLETPYFNNADVLELVNYN